jgi:hypothetical protein
MDTDEILRAGSQIQMPLPSVFGMNDGLISADKHGTDQRRRCSV